MNHVVWVIKPPLVCLCKVKERRNPSALNKVLRQAGGSPERLYSLSCNHHHVAVGLSYAVLFLDQKTRTPASSCIIIISPGTSDGLYIAGSSKTSEMNHKKRVTIK